MTERERNIGIGTGATVLIALAYQFVVQPYVDARDALNTRQAALQTQLDDADTLFSREHHLRQIWNELQQGGVGMDASHAEGQTLRAIIAWANKAGVNLSGLKPERSTEEQKFQVISFSVTCTGAMPDVARLLWSMETASIPLRVDELDIRPVKEGTDNLNVRIGVSALCLPPQAAAGGNVGGGSSR